MIIVTVRWTVAMNQVPTPATLVSSIVKRVPGSQQQEYRRTKSMMDIVTVATVLMNGLKLRYCTNSVN